MASSRLALVYGLGLVAVLAGIAPAHATSVPAVGLLVNGAQGLCLDPVGSAGKVGDALVLAPCAEVRDALWGLTGQGTVGNAMAFSCLDVAKAEAKAGDAALLGACNGATPRRWTLRQRGDGLELVDRASGLCLDPADKDGRAGATLALAACDGASDQRWRLDLGSAVARQALAKIPPGVRAARFLGLANAKPNGDVAPAEIAKQLAAVEAAAAPNPIVVKGLLVNRKKNLCLDASGYGGDKGDPIQLYRCDGYKDQTYTFDAAGELVNDAGELCLDAKGYEGESGAKMQLWGCDKKPDQTWRLAPSGDWFELRNGKKDLCLDVRGKDGAQGDEVTLWACDGGADQQWQFVTLPPLPLGKALGFYSRNGKRFIRTRDDGKAAATPEVIPDTSGAPRFRDGALTTEPETLADVVPAGWYYAFFRVEYAGDGAVALRSLAWPRYLQATRGGPETTGETDTLPASWPSVRLEVVDLGDGTVALYSPHAERYFKITAGGKLELAAAQADGQPPDRFDVVPLPSGYPAMKAKSDANPACVAALSCLFDGATRKVMDPICSSGCDQSSSTVGQLLGALRDNDMIGLCSGGVRAALDITTMALTGFIESIGEQMLKAGVCSDDGGSPACNGNADCNVRVGGAADACDPRAKAEEWANKLCSATSYSRGAGTPMGCGGDEVELTAGLCYPKCPKGYPEGNLTDCYERTPAGTVCAGTVCGSGSKLVTRKVKPRGVAVPLHTCPGGPEKSGALCYPPCAPGFKGVADRCWKE